MLGPVTFSGNNTVAVNSGAKRVYVICGSLCVCIFKNGNLSSTFDANTPEMLLFRPEYGTGLVCLPVGVLPDHQVSIIFCIF
jgi:hypothetical protein